MSGKFGELTLEEFNNMAEGFKAEGDIESLKILAGEYLIDKYDLEDYIAGDIEELATGITFSLGRLQAEYNDKVGNSKNPWEALPFKAIYSMSVSMIYEIADGICTGKKKKLEDIVNEMQKIAKEKSSGNEAVCVCGTDKQLRDIIRAYYSKGIKEAANIINGLGVENSAGI